MTRAFCVCLLLAGIAVGQGSVTFEPAVGACLVAAYPSPCGAAGGAEGLSKNAVASGGASFDNLANGAGMPTQGAQYGRVVAFGPDVAGGGSHLYIPIPVNATNVSFTWDFYDAEGGQSGFNDGMAIDALGACGGLSLANFVLADDNTFVAGTGVDSTGACSSGAFELAPNGPQSVIGAVLPAGSALLRVSVWNGSDNVAASHGCIDDIVFTCSGTCSGPACTLYFSSPNGPGSIRMQNLSCPAQAGKEYLIGITLAGGTFPTGFYGGLDISFSALLNQYQSGYPFHAFLDAAGASDFGPTPAFSLPSGLQVWAVSGQWTIGAGMQFRPPVTYTIP